MCAMPRVVTVIPHSPYAGGFRWQRRAECYSCLVADTELNASGKLPLFVVYAD
jgi:hypothetical protein